jgi:hypothetical protein
MKIILGLLSIGIIILIWWVVKKVTNEYERMRNEIMQMGKPSGKELKRAAMEAQGY